MSTSTGNTNAHENDLYVPLNGTSQLPSPIITRVRDGTAASEEISAMAHGRQRTTISEDVGERAAKMRIDLDSSRNKTSLEHKRFTADFRFKAEMAIRVAFGVLLASAIQARDPNYDSSAEHSKKWLLFPAWYYLGGLSYCAVAVIFSAQTNVGATLKQVCQAFYGTGMALVYNIVLFAIYEVRAFDASANDPYAGFVKIEKTFNASSYWVNEPNFYVVLPWIMIFTVVVLLMPIENNTKKFAVGNNLYFTLTIINPQDPLDSSQLKAQGDAYFGTSNILNNLALYFLVGFVGTLVSLLVMFIPYPVFAINRLRTETQKASDDILDLLNLIVDSYCFKNKNVDHMNFLRLKLRRKFQNATSRHQRMHELLLDVWWEQLFGFHLLLKFNRSIIKNYVRLVESLIADLQSLNDAMQLEKYEQLHVAFMNVLQREIYVIQIRSGHLLEEISKEVHDSTLTLGLQAIRPLEAQMESTLLRYRATQNHTFRRQKPTLQDVEGNVPLNLFLFSLNSFCSSLIGFQETHNARNHMAGIRARSFLKSSFAGFIDRKQYTALRFMSAIKVSIAIFVGNFLAVYVYGYSNTTPAAVAYVMGNHIGGSFSVTVNRVGGVVAGSVIPSVLEFFISQICSPAHLNTFLSELALFVWVTISMYVYFAGGYGSYAGVVSAFIAAGILLRQSDACLADGTDTSSSIAISSYSSLAQTSVGIVLFILVELAFKPESATGLLRKNIQETLRLLQESFTTLFGHHLSTSESMDNDTLKELQNILHVEIPKLLQEQKQLLQEAKIEPMLWRPAFSYQKYESVLQNCHRLLNSNNLLLKLVRWFSFRVKESKARLSTKVAVDNRDGGGSGDKGSYIKWELASQQLLSSVGDTFITLQMLFGVGFVHADAEQTALFMQMKEAFRLVDKDCSGEIDTDEVAALLESIFAQSGGVKEHDIQSYVDEFMAVVDKDNSGMVSFEEFMEALENGLKVEVEVYQKRKRKASVLQNVALLETIVEGARLNSSVARRSSATSNPAVEERGRSRHDSAPWVFNPARARFSSSQFNGSNLLSPMRRQHDVLNVEDFTLSEIAGSMKSAYVEWLMEGNRYEKVSMEELLLLNCLVSGTEGIARNLAELEETLVAN